MREARGEWLESATISTKSGLMRLNERGGWRMRCLWKGWGGDSFPSANKQEDGTTPHDNLVCLLCQREARVRLEVDWWLDCTSPVEKVAVAG